MLEAEAISGGRVYNVTTPIFVLMATSCEDSVQQRFSEHSYAKQSWVEPVAGDQEEPMDTSTPSSSMIAHETLTALNSNEDTFEVFLLTLLRAHSASQLGNTAAEGDITDIAPESLSTLTFEQIQSVMTSTSVNYNVVQQILAQKETLGKPMDVDDGQKLGEEAVGGEGDSKVVSSDSGGVSSSSGDESSQSQAGPPTLPPQAQLGAGLSIKLTAEQLTQLQAQVSELLLQQSVLPPNLSPKQQQALVQSLIAKQLNIQQQPMTSVKDSTLSPKSSHNGNHQLQEQLGLKDSPSPTSSSSSSTTSLPPPSKRKKESDTKRPRTPFNLYFSDVYSSVQSENPKLSFSEASKIVSKRWNQLGQEGKQKYYDQHELLKADFKQKTGGSSPDDAELITSKPKSSKADVKKERRPSVENKIKAKSEEVERVKEPGMCAATGCYNMATEGAEEKGGNYCSNECVVKHCKNIFQNWIVQRKQRS